MDKRKHGVFVDTSGFKAIIDPRDEFHEKAVGKWMDLEKRELGLITSNYVLDECYTLIRVRCGLEVIKEFRDLMADSGNDIKVVRITLPDELNAWSWFEKDWSHLSFTDCVSFALMKRLRLTEFFGFDNHFKRAGFKAV